MVGDDPLTESEFIKKNVILSQRCDGEKRKEMTLSQRCDGETHTLGDALVWGCQS